jgi:nucleotide-binding universal stress UspA family protein
VATYQKILVPLDGSKQSECILDHVRIIAKALGTPKVVLLKVVEPFSSGAIAVIGDTQAKKVLAETKRAAEEYLSYAAGTLRTHCAGVEQIVIEGNPAEVILDQAKKLKVDLIAMSTHGESGIVRWAMGSVTGRVLEHAQTPVLTVTPSGCRP